jgi:hypothetical protein
MNSNAMDVAWRNFIIEFYGDSWSKVTVQERNKLFEAFKAGWKKGK